MSSPAPISTASPQPRLFISVGMKMLMVSGSFLILSFLICGLTLVSLSRRMLRSEFEEKLARDSHFITILSEPLLENGVGLNKPRLTDAARSLLKDPAILGIAILDHAHHTVTQVSKTILPSHPPFSFLAPIRSERHTVGWIRVWYSPGLALEEVWQWGGDLVIVLLCGVLFLFALIFLAMNEWILARPFKTLLDGIEEAGRTGATMRLGLNRRDEWGLLGERLNGFLHRVTDVQLQSAVLYESSRLLSLPVQFKGTVEGILTDFLHRNHLSSALIFGRSESAELRVQFSSGISTALAETLKVVPGQGATGVAFASGEQRLLTDLGPEENDSVIRELVNRQQVNAVFFVPLVVEGESLGIAAYFSRESRMFTDRLNESLVLFTRQLALAVRNARLVTELKAGKSGLEQNVAATAHELTQTNLRLVRKVRELKSIYDLALATAASTNVEEIIQVIISGVKELVEVQGAAFFLYDAASGDLDPLPPAFDRPATEAKTFRCKVQDSKLLQAVIRDGQPQILNFIEPGEPLPAAWAPVAIHSLLALPLRHDRVIEGLFCIVNKVNGLFTDDDIRLLSLLTNRVSEVLRRLELDQQLRQRVQDLSILQEIATHLPSPPVLTDTVATIGRITRQAVPGVDTCLFFLHHPESEALVMRGGDWDPAMTFDSKGLTIGISEKVPLADVFRQSQAAYYGLGSTALLWEKDELIPLLQLKDLFYAPLSVEHRTIGVMAIGGRKPGVLTLEHRRIVGLIAEQVAVVIERSRLYERLHSANEKLEQINHLKNEFISMVSHELRTPLTTIKGFVSIVLNEEIGPLNAQQRHFLETSDRAIDRLTLLVSDLLDISRIEAGQIQMQLRPVSLVEILSRISTNFGPQFKAQNLQLFTQLPEHLPLLMADPHRLTQVFDNLLSNALKFTSQGGITISAVDKGDFVMISVRDTGSGIPKHEQDHIFEKFYQIKVGGAYPSKGTGLGLAIVKSIVESHRGKVWVESEEGKGADFRLIIPRARMEASGRTESVSGILG